MMHIDLRGKVALVTGGASGIDEAVARLLSQAGADLVIADIQSAKAEAVAAAIRKDNGHASAQSIDVRQDESVCAGVRTGPPSSRTDRHPTAREAKKVPFTLTARTSSQSWDVMRSTGRRRMTPALLTRMPSMQQRGKGRIINIASNSGKTGPLVAVLRSLEGGGHRPDEIIRSLACRLRSDGQRGLSRTHHDSRRG